MTADTRSILAFWRDLRGENVAPMRSQIDAAKMRPWLSRIALVEKAPDGRLRNRIVGGGVERFIGANRTGRFLEDYVADSARRAIMEPYDLCAQTRRPVASRLGGGDFGNAFAALDRLIMPLLDENNDLSFFLTFFDARDSRLMAGESIYSVAPRPARSDASDAFLLLLE